MKQTIRINCFETNSSSYHSLTLTNHDKIKNLLTDVENIINDLDTTEEIYQAIAKLDMIKELLVRNLVDGGYHKNDYYD